MSVAHPRGSLLADTLGAEGLRRETGVSRETLERLAAYLELLRIWQQRIDLVAPSTMPDVWRRHVLDSAQLAPLIPDDSTVADLGTGAGFPGIVLAILGKTVHLIESDQRKAAFLREALRVTNSAADIHVKRIEAVDLKTDIVTARALAPLPRLLPLAFPLLKPGGMMLLLKGQTVDAELAEVERHWTFVADRFTSRSDPRGIVLRLREIGHVESA